MLHFSFFGEYVMQVANKTIQHLQKGKLRLYPVNCKKETKIHSDLLNRVDGGKDKCY